MSVPDIKIKKVVKPPRKTLQEVFGAGAEVKKFKFKDFFKTKEGKQIIKQQKQISQNINRLAETGLPEVITKEVAKDIVRVDTKPIIFGRIPGLDLSGGFGDLGVLSNRLGGGLLIDLEEQQKQKGGIIGRTDTGSLTRLETEQEEKKRLKAGLLFPDVTKVIEDLGQIPKTSPLFAQIQPQAQLQLQLQKLQTNLAGIGITPITITPTIVPEIPKIPTPIPFIFDIPEKKIKKLLPPKLDIGFDVFVKSKGKQIKVTKNPVIINTAKDIGSFLVDNTLSAQFSLKESKKQPQQPKIQVPRNYWELNKNKFRTFKIRKGEQIPLKNIFIEKMPRRLDTFGEIRNITAERLLAQQRGKKKNIDQISKNLNKIFGF